MSLKNVAKSQQRAHRERSQPAAREHLGLLEKKKDYKLRARDFEQKRNALALLRRKVLNKNPDEFYFHMVNSRIEDGVHYEKDKEDEMTEAQKKLIKSQDLNYVRYKRNIEDKKIDKLRSELHLIGSGSSPGTNKHVFFVDSKEEAKKFNLAEHLDTHPSLIKSRNYNMLRNKDLATLQLASAKVSAADLKGIMSQQEQSYNQLSNRLDRAKELRTVERRLEVDRCLLSKSMKPKLVAEGTKVAAPQYKWKFERKK